MNMWSSSRRVLQDLLSQPAVRSFSLSPAQNTVVVERWWDVPLSKVGSPPRLSAKRHKIYKLVEDTRNGPKEKMELILTQTVPKLGGRGDTVFVRKNVGRNKLLPQGLAVYASPENKEMFAEELRLLHDGRPEDRIQTRTGQMTVDLLKRSQLKINKMPPDDFQLTKEVVCRQLLKKLGVVVPTHALNLPFEPIKDLGDYWCEVTVNGISTVRIPMTLLPYEDQSAAYQNAKKRQQANAKLSEAAAEEEKEEENEDEGVLKAASDAPVVETEAGKDSVSQASASEETASTTQTAQDTTAPPSDTPKNN